MSPSDVPPLTTLFRTLSTSYAACLIATDSLRYVSAERTPTGIAFAFEDPHSQGAELQRRFNAGMFPRVEPKALFSARGFLVAEMARLNSGGHNAKK